MISSALNISIAREQGNQSYLVDHQIPAYIRNTAIVFCVVIMCLGVVGNVMVPIVIMKTKDMRNSTNIFLMNLSLADLMVLLVCTPTVLVEVNTKPETWILGKEMCLLVPFIELTVAHASVLTILAISFERYYAICEPLRAGYVCTKYRAVCICVLAWIAAATFASPILAIANYHYMVLQDGSSIPVCLTQATAFWPTLYFLMIIAVFFVVPLLMLIILYSIIALSLVKTKSKVTLNQHADALSIKGRRQVVLMLATVVLSFFFCLTPFRMLTIWIIVSNEDSVDKIGLEPYYNMLYFSRIMIYLNSAINPILYNLMSSKFRNGFRKLCCTCQSTGFKFRTHRSSSSHVTASTSCQSGSSRDRRSHSLRIIYRKSSATNTIEKISDKNKDMNEITRKLDIFLERAPTRRHSDIVSQKEKVVPKFEKNREDLEENDEIEITLKVDVRKRISMDHKRLLRILNEEKTNMNHV